MAQSGALTEIGSPIAAGNNPVRIVAAPNGKFVYVVNQGDNNVQLFAVQSDGTLASKGTYATGSHPTAIAIDPQGAFVYVTFSYQSGTLVQTVDLISDHRSQSVSVQQLPVRVGCRGETRGNTHSCRAEVRGHLAL